MIFTESHKNTMRVRNEIYPNKIDYVPFLDYLGWCIPDLY